MNDVLTILKKGNADGSDNMDKAIATIALANSFNVFAGNFYS